MGSGWGWWVLGLVAGRGVGVVLGGSGLGARVVGGVGGVWGGPWGGGQDLRARRKRLPDSQGPRVPGSRGLVPLAWRLALAWPTAAHQR